MLSILKAIWQADGAFPSGSFAFSYGLEGVAALRGRMEAAALSDLVAAVLRQRWANCDRVALVRAFRAGDDIAAIAAIDRDVEASTFGESLRLGSRRNGSAFLASHARLDNTMALRLRRAVGEGQCLGHIAVMQGAVWRAIGLDETLAQIAAGYACVSGLTAAAVRLGVISALEGQKVLCDVLPLIDELAAQPLPSGGQLASFLPFVEIAAARHARADLRLFAN